MASGRRSKRASASPVAATPRLRPMPARAPASRPTLAGLDTQRPTSSRSGRASIPAMAWTPTLPVLQATTRCMRLTTAGAAGSGSQVGQPEVHVGLLHAPVHLEDLAGHEGAGRRREIHHVGGDVLGL